MDYQLTATPKDKPYNEIQNYAAFAAIKSDGSVVAWGNSDFGGTAPNMTNVKQIFSTGYAFAALKNDGLVVSWGTDGNGNDINNTISNIKTISSTESAFAALTNDGKVIAWGNSTNGGQNDNNSSLFDSLINVKEIYSNSYAFTAIKNDSVVYWGAEGNSVGMSGTLDISVNIGKPHILATTNNTFAAIQTDGSVVEWGGAFDPVPSYISNSSDKDFVAVKEIYATEDTFAVIRVDGSVATWGDTDTPDPEAQELNGTNDVLKIYANSTSFAALRADHSVVRWGGYSAGLDVIENISQIFSSSTSFAAISDDGSVVTWGDMYAGGNSKVYKYDGNIPVYGDNRFSPIILKDVTNDLRNVKTIFSNNGAFAALTNDGSVITWGKSSYGGDSSSVATQLINVKNIFTTNGGAFAALREGGSVVTWGDFSDISSQLDIVSIANATTDDNYVVLAPLPSPLPPQPVVIKNYTPTESVSITGTPPPQPVVIANYAPTGSVSITGTPSQGQVLTASNNLADANGMGAVSYQWFNNSGAIQNATQTSFTLTQADVGKTFSVTASYTDYEGFSASVASSSTTVVANVNDLPTGAVVIKGTPTQGQVLTASNTLADIDGLGAITYQWQNGGKDIAGATQSTYVLIQNDVDKTISVKASYSDKFGATESVGSAATAKIVDVNDKPSGRVSISGTPAQNHTLTASNDLSDLDGIGPISYQWLRNNIAISNATQATYALTQIDVGKVMTVKASYTDGLGNPESVIGGFFSPGLDPLTIANENDSPNGDVSITGMAKKGHVLSASNTLTDIDGLGGIHYQWLNEGNVIANANQASYELTQADVGKNIRVKASYTDLQKTNESMTSAAMLISANKETTGAITLKGSPVWGTTLSASSTLKDGDGLGKLSYSWQNATGELSTSPSYRLGEDDIDTKVWLTVHYTDRKGNIEEVESEPVDVTISKKSSAYNDILEGTAAADKLSGFGGNDTLVGGVGSDKLTGGKGSDVFKFTSSDFYTKSSNGSVVFNQSVDTVTDFNLKEHDVLDFGDLGALGFYSTLKDAQDDLASLFYVKGLGKIYLNTNNADGFMPTVIVVLTGKPAVNTDLTDWNYPAV